MVGCGGALARTSHLAREGKRLSADNIIVKGGQAAWVKDAAGKYRYGIVVDVDLDAGVLSVKLEATGVVVSTTLADSIHAGTVIDDDYLQSATNRHPALTHERSHIALSLPSSLILCLDPCFAPMRACVTSSALTKATPVTLLAQLSPMRYAVAFGSLLLVSACLSAAAGGSVGSFLHLPAALKLGSVSSLDDPDPLNAIDAIQGTNECAADVFCLGG